MNITKYKKTREIPYAFNAKKIKNATVKHKKKMQLFQQFVQSLQSPTFIQKFSIGFFCSLTFKDIQILYKNSIFVTETRVCMKVRLLPSSVCLGF